MDPVKILKRAWYILWSYRALWVFGLILALAAGGSSSGNANNGSRYEVDRNSSQTPPQSWEEMKNEMDQLFRHGIPDIDVSGEALTAFLWVVGFFIVFMFAFGIIVTIARYVSETAVIRMVDEYEATNTKMTVREGFRIGWSRTAWQLFLIDLLVNLPAILLALVLLITGIGMFVALINGSLTFNPFSMISLVGVMFLLIFVVAIASIILRLFRQFFWRVCALENLGVQESFRHGFALVRAHWKDVGLMWLIMIGLGIAWIIVSIILILVTLPLVLVTSIIAAAVVVLPGLLLVGVFSLFLGGPLPWVAGLLFVLPLFFVIAFSPWLLLGSWQQVYTSSVWTLTYREIKALPMIASKVEPVA